MKAEKIMRKTKFLILMIIAFCAAASDAQKKPKAPPTPIFTSVYSDLSQGKSCRTIEQEFIGCKAVGNYRLFAAFHSVLERVWVETIRGEEVFDIPSNTPKGISRNAGKFEWRLANGKPFAIIARFEYFSMDDVEANRDLSPEGRSKFPQILVVRGLPGYEQINFELDARLTPDANQKARDFADANYRKNK